MPFDPTKFKSTPEDAAKFDLAPYDAEAGRGKFISRLTRALKQFNKEQGLQGGKDFEVGYHGQIRFKPTLNGQHIYIETADEAYFATSDDNFANLIIELSKAVEAGEFDARIEAALTAVSVDSPATPAPKATKAKSVSTGPKTEEQIANGVKKAFGIAIGKGATPAAAAAAIKAKQVELESAGKPRAYTDAHIAAELALREKTT